VLRLKNAQSYAICVHCVVKRHKYTFTFINILIYFFLFWKKDQNCVYKYEIFGFHGVENVDCGCVVGGAV
jgi:hypothetical protein